MKQSRFAVFYLALTVGGLFFGTAHAELCFPPADAQPNSPYRYVIGMTDAFTHAKQGVERLKRFEGSLEKEGIMDVMLALKLGADEYLCAAAQVEPYRKSKVEAIAGSADGLVDVFSHLAQHNQAYHSKLQAVLFSMGDTKERRGTTTEIIADLLKIQDETWKSLALATFMATDSLVEVDPETHRPSRFRLSTAEREEVKRRLVKTFGEGITEGIKTGQPALTASAVVIYHFVADSAWPSRDAKK